MKRIINKLIIGALACVSASQTFCAANDERSIRYLADGYSIEKLKQEIASAQENLKNGEDILAQQRQLTKQRNEISISLLYLASNIDKAEQALKALQLNADKAIQKAKDAAALGLVQYAGESSEDYRNRNADYKYKNNLNVQRITADFANQVKAKEDELAALKAKQAAEKPALEAQNNQVLDKMRQIRPQIAQLEPVQLKLKIYQELLTEKQAKQPRQPAQSASQPQPALNKQALMTKIYKNIEDKKIKNEEIGADIANFVKQFGAQGLNTYIPMSDRTLIQHAMINRPGIAVLLIQNGANPNYTGQSNKPTALVLFMKGMEATKKAAPAKYQELKPGYNSVIRAFITAGADLTKKDEQGRTAYDIAKSMGADQNVLELENPAKGGAAAAALQPIQAKNPADTQELLNKLTDAVELHDKTLPFTEEDEKTNATRETKIADARKATDKLLPEISTLLRTADVQTKDASGYTALHLAVMTDNPAIVNAVLNAGGRGDLHTQDNDGKTPAALAAELSYNDIAQLLK